MQGNYPKGRKEAVWAQIEQFVSSKPKFFVTMTAVNKIGINPKFSYGNPVGVYCYQLTPEIFQQLQSGTLPFVTDQAYIQVFSLNVAPFDLSKYSQVSYSHDKTILEKEYEQWRASDKSNIELQMPFSRIVAQCYKEERSGTAFGRIWWLTNLLAARKTQTDPDEQYQGRVLQWRKLLIMLGFTNIVDPGIGIIHENEPTQTVVLDASVITPVKAFINPNASAALSSVVGKEDSALIKNRLRKNKPKSRNDSSTNYTGKVVFPIDDTDSETCHFLNGKLNDHDDEFASALTVDGKPWRFESWRNGVLKFVFSKIRRNGSSLGARGASAGSTVWAKSDADGVVTDILDTPQKKMQYPKLVKMGIDMNESLTRLLGLEWLAEARKTTADALSEGVGVYEFDGEQIALVDFYSAALAVDKMRAKDVAEVLSDTENLPEWLLGMSLIKAFCEYDTGDQRRPYTKIFTMAAEPGYGPMMYYIVASLSSNGFIGSDNSVTPAAAKIWQKFETDGVERKVRPEIVLHGEVDEDEWEQFSEKMPAGIDAMKYIYKPTDPNLTFRKLKQETRVGEKYFQDVVMAKLKEAGAEKSGGWLQHFRTYLYATGLLYFNRRYHNA